MSDEPERWTTAKLKEQLTSVGVKPKSSKALLVKQWKIHKRGQELMARRPGERLQEFKDSFEKSKTMASSPAVVPPGDHRIETPIDDGRRSEVATAPLVSGDGGIVEPATLSSSDDGRDAAPTSLVSGEYGAGNGDEDMAPASLVSGEYDAGDGTRSESATPGLGDDDEDDDEVPPATLVSGIYETDMVDDVDSAAQSLGEDGDDDYDFLSEIASEEFCTFATMPKAEKRRRLLASLDNEDSLRVLPPEEKERERQRLVNVADGMGHRPAWELRVLHRRNLGLPPPLPIVFDLTPPGRHLDTSDLRRLCITNGLSADGSHQDLKERLEDYTTRFRETWGLPPLVDYRPMNRGDIVREVAELKARHHDKTNDAWRQYVAHYKKDGDILKYSGGVREARSDHDGGGGERIR